MSHSMQKWNFIFVKMGHYTITEGKFTKDWVLPRLWDKMDFMDKVLFIASSC